MKAFLRNYLRLGSRVGQSCPVRRRAGSTLLERKVLKANAERVAQDVITMDALLEKVRDRTNPENKSIMPLRTPTFWIESIKKLDSQTPILSSLTSHDNLASASPDQLEERYMHDSYTELVLPFSCSPELCEQYTNAGGGLRIGKLMEHLDSLAGSISYKHMLGPGVQELGSLSERGYYIVTAAVERLDMLVPIDMSQDLRLSGQVIYTGHSSMEVVVKMEVLGSDQSEQTVLLGRFSMVCRNATSHKAHKVVPLKITTKEERSLHSIGKDLKEKRQAFALKSLSLVPPSPDEAKLLHDFYLKCSEENSSTNQVPLEATKLENCVLMFPQERNVHQKIFGGYLMRLAYELAFINAAVFSRGHVRFLSLDGITFNKPVPIGSILHLESYTVHSATTNQFSALVHVIVKASVVDVKTGSEQVTNDFRFTWCREGGEPLLRKLVPKSYKDCMLWLEGKRAFEIGAEIRTLCRCQKFRWQKFVNTDTQSAGTKYISAKPFPVNFTTFLSELFYDSVKVGGNIQSTSE